MKTLLMIAVSVMALSTVAFAQVDGAGSDPATTCVAKKGKEKRACCKEFTDKKAHKICLKSK